MGLFKNITTGVNDLFEKPIEGFIHGPLEGGLGLLNGALSLVKNTLAGVFNSVNKITGSISSGLAFLCMDQEYLEQREKTKTKKPKHFIDGLEQGTISIVSGIGQGISGVFLKPYYGAKKQGIKGFFKGTF